MENPNTNFKFQIEKTLELNICAASLNKKPKKNAVGMFRKFQLNIPPTRALSWQDIES